MDFLKYTPGGHVCTTQKSSEFVTLSFIELKSYTCKFILIMYPGITCVPGVHSLLATSTVVYVVRVVHTRYHVSQIIHRPPVASHDLFQNVLAI